MAIESDQITDLSVPSRNRRVISIKSQNKYADICGLGWLPFEFLYVSPCTVRRSERFDGGTLLPIQRLIDYKIAFLGKVRYSRMLYTILFILIRSDVTGRYKCRHVREFKADRVIESVREISKQSLVRVQYRNIAFIVSIYLALDTGRYVASQFRILTEG